ncbi:hypothetical protein APHAL10511_003546 [Amanita phalloides]|nr:hypothetical protein APHAL10511_003546 [Amanita phalloides]
MHESRAGFDYDFALLIPRRTPHIKDGNARLILRDLCMFKPASVIVWLTLTSIFDYAHPVAVVAIPSSKRKPNFWFSLGDSYTATGFDPSGILPSIGNPLGNPPYPGSTATRGANWVDYLTTTYNESLIFTYNLAYGGATIDSKLVKPYLPTVKSLTDQVNEYMASFSDHPASVPWKTRNTLFSIWIGINDIGNSFYLGGDRNEFNEVLLDAYFGLVEKLVGGNTLLVLRELTFSIVVGLI